MICISVMLEGSIPASCPNLLNSRAQCTPEMERVAEGRENMLRPPRRVRVVFLSNAGLVEPGDCTISGLLLGCVLYC